MLDENIQREGVLDMQQQSQTNKKFELGVYSLADIGVNPTTGDRPTLKQRMEDIIAAAKIADEAGLDIFGLGEHHRHDYAISSPAVVLSAIAQATKSIKLTSTTTVLNTTDPVKLFEDFATLDLISNGRAEIMVGRGAFAESFPLFGYDPAYSDELFEEHLELLMQLNQNPTITWQGKHRPNLYQAQISPRPLQAQLPVSVGVGASVESAKRAGRYGANLSLAVLSGHPEYFEPFVEAYYSEAIANGHSAQNLNLTVTGHLFLAESDELALRQFYPYYTNYWNYVNRQRGFNSTISEVQYREMMHPDSAVLVGSPDLVIEKILQQYELYGHTRLLAQIDIGGLPFKYVARNIEWFATRVAPIVRREINK